MNLKKFQFFAYAVFMSSSSCAAEPNKSQGGQYLTYDEIGDEKRLCNDCPIFVRVPDAPNKLRPIKYVSKFELTWNNYLAAYDDGSCPIPNPYAGFVPPKENNIPPHLDKYRIDWPIVLLGPAEVECYSNWLQRKTDLLVRLPTEKEWEWFARAGRKNAKFPWGDDIDLSKAAVKDNQEPNQRDGPLAYADGGKHIMHNVFGVKVGMFPPNDWGLHDVIGNSWELTADTISGEEWNRRHPDSESARRTQSYGVVTIKGSGRYNLDWGKHGISGARYLTNFGFGYSSHAALRLTLISKSGK